VDTDVVTGQYFRVTLLGEDSKVKEALTRLAEHTENERGMVLALTHSSIKRTEKGVEGLESSTTVMLYDSKQQNTEEENRKILNTELDGEALTKVSRLNETLNEQRLPGSGDWLLAEPLFREWVQRKAPLLWILGGPGAGKSFLSSRIIRHLKDVQSQKMPLPGATSVAFFYIKEDDSQLRSLITILKSIALQIAKNDLTFRSHAVNVCNSPDHLLTTTQTWQKLFIDHFASTQNDGCVYIVIDGLDEASREERETLLGLLVDLFDAPLGRMVPRIQVLLVGRLELQDDMQMAWDDRTIRIGKRFIEVSAKKNSGDISEYITREVEKVRILKSKALSRDDRSALRMEIVEKFKTNANGMFLWVNLMLKEIMRKSQKSEVRAALKNTPQGLVKMIRHVFERLAADPDLNKDNFTEMLGWVACAERPLFLGELGLILKLISPVEEAILGLEDDLRGRYASFFTLKRADSLTTEDLQRRAEQNSKVEHEKHRKSKDGLDASSDDESDEGQGYQSDPASTTVEFSHASVRDYLGQEGMPAELGIGIEMNDTQRRIATTCLSVIADHEHGTKYGQPNLSNYAAAYFLQHLIQVDKFKVNDEDKRRIIPLLYSFFHDESTMKRWYSLAGQQLREFIINCFAHDRFAKTIRCWFEEKECLDNLGPEDRVWAEKAASSTKELFKPLAIFLAGGWLKPSSMFKFDWVICILFLHYYLSIDEGSIRTDVGATKSGKLVQLRSLSSERIKELAKFAGFEETSYWHSALAYLLGEADYDDDAIEEMEVAIRMDDHNFWALYGMGNCFGKKFDISRACDWYFRALKVIPEEDPKEEVSLYCAIWSQIGFLRKGFGDLEGAVEASRQALLASPEDSDAIGEHLVYLGNTSRYQEIIELAEKLDGQPAKVGQGNALTELLHGTPVHRPIAIAAQALGRLDFAINAFEQAKVLADQRNDDYTASKQRDLLARIYYSVADNEDRAVQLWEDMIANSTSYINVKSIKLAALNSLSEVYFERARATENREADPAFWVSQLQRVSKIPMGPVDSEEDLLSREVGNPSWMLGLWYRLHGQHNEARACFRTTVLECIGVLRDGISYRGTGCYYYLQQALLKAGDRANAMVALAIFSKLLNEFSIERAAKADASHKPDRVGAGTKTNIGDEKGLEATESESIDSATSSEPVIRHRINGSAADRIDGVAQTEATINVDNKPVLYRTARIWFECDGTCKQDWVDTALYACELCLNIVFCDACLKLLRTKKLPFRICNPDHSFLQIYPLDEKALEIAVRGGWENKAASGVVG